MKKIFAIVFLFVFAFSLFGFMLVFKIEQHRVKKEIKARLRLRLNEEELTQIVVTTENKNQFLWKDKKEFEYKNVMYDLVKTKVVNTSSTIYFCISDKAETNLFNKFNKLISENTDYSKNGNTSLKKMIKLFLNLFSEDLSLFSHLIQSTVTIYSEYTDTYSSTYHKVNIPPPKSV